jgi:putative oxygen-independent coproporphyrinogen III oxidase
MQSIIHKLNSVFSISPTVEITVEADPGTFQRQKIVEWADLGINRLSLGVQSFDDNILTSCGRAHRRSDVIKAVEDIHSSTISNFNVDLISSLPNLSEELWINTLEEACQINSTHISVYDLQIEEKTAFSRWQQSGRISLPSELLSTRMFKTASQKLSNFGFEHYEISNYAKPSYKSNHNRKYWNCSPICAFGMGAASYIQGHRFTRPSTLESYSAWLSDCEIHDWLYSKSVSRASEFNFDWVVPDLEEFVMLSLRTRDGLHLRKLNDWYNSSIVDEVLFSLQP